MVIMCAESARPSSAASHREGSPPGSHSTLVRVGARAGVRRGLGSGLWGWPHRCGFGGRPVLPRTRLRSRGEFAMSHTPSAFAKAALASHTLASLHSHPAHCLASPALAIHPSHLPTPRLPLAYPSPIYPAPTPRLPRRAYPAPSPRHCPNAYHRLPLAQTHTINNHTI